MSFGIAILAMTLTSFMFSANRWIGSTQLAVTYARRAFPCFDEPAFKAAFRLTLDHKPDYHAISNMPLKSVNTLQDGWKSSIFEDSVPMSTYLMAWTVFDFMPLNTTTGDGVKVILFEIILNNYYTHTFIADSSCVVILEKK